MIVAQLAKILSVLYVTRGFITVLTKPRHYILSHFNPAHIFTLYSFVIKLIFAISCHLQLGLPSDFFSLTFSTCNFKQIC